MDVKIEQQKEIILEKQNLLQQELDKNSCLDVELKETAIQINHKKRKLFHKKAILIK